MPIYEYRCRDCGRTSTFVTRSVSEALDPRCGTCGSANMDKLVSRVAVRRSASSRAESLADPAAFGGLDEKDPGSVARWMKSAGREMGEETGEDPGEDFEDDVDRALDGDAEGTPDGVAGDGPDDEA
jgi:putative FmdB family regulatory protein